MRQEINASENIVCWSRLLQILLRLYNKVKYRIKQRWPEQTAHIETV